MGVVICLFAFHIRVVSLFETFGFRICFEFRASDFEFVKSRDGDAPQRG